MQPSFSRQLFDLFPDPELSRQVQRRGQAQPRRGLQQGTLGRVSQQEQLDQVGACSQIDHLSRSVNAFKLFRVIIVQVVNRGVGGMIATNPNGHYVAPT